MIEPQHVVILRGAEDPSGRSIPGTVDALRAAGHHVRLEEVAGLGHEYPADFADRFAAAGIRTP